MAEAFPPPPGAWRRLRRNPVAIAAMLILVAVVYLALDGPRWFRYDPETLSKLQFSPPAYGHPFGTDVNGRDVLSRVIQGARISLLVGACGALISFFIGTSYGMVAGYFGGKLDAAMMRFVEILYSIPRLILIIIASASFDPYVKVWLQRLGFTGLVGYSKILILILALGLIEWLTMARIVRGQVLSLKSQQFVLAARSLGQSHFKIITHHLLPNIVGIVVIYLTLTIPAVILDESFLSFLGLGIQAPQASWGTLLSDGAQVINPVKSYWWLLLFPALVMSITLLALNFLGDALRDALDPRARR
ncbi:MAG: oligopeptide transport system permease protein [Chthoniobacter sp.]|jgi:peptide/nickel transport system permease protein/oligopeptide transport system permease protein|nr:oligopeptide transport system permease protein [Chthoniobacter sp.]